MKQDKIKVIFIGGLSNGKIVYDYLKSNKYVDLLLAITYPDDVKVARFTPLGQGDRIVKTLKAADFSDTIKELNPDLIFVAGWSELIPDAILSIPQMGAIGFHPAKLPSDRGRSVVAWQIEEGYTETALTMFKYSNYPDGGDILAQERIFISHDDYVSDILDKIDSATFNIMRAYFPLLRQGLIKARKQDLSEGNFRRLRGAADSIIDWKQPSRTIYNKVRAISHPYPGATATYKDKTIIVWRSSIVAEFPFGNDLPAGTLVAELFDGSLLYKTRDSFIRILEFEFT